MQIAVVYIQMDNQVVRVNNLNQLLRLVVADSSPVI